MVWVSFRKLVKNVFKGWDDWLKFHDIVYGFSVDYSPTEKEDTFNIHENILKGNNANELNKCLLRY